MKRITFRANIDVETDQEKEEVCAVLNHHIDALMNLEEWPEIKSVYGVKITKLGKWKTGREYRKPVGENSIGTFYTVVCSECGFEQVNGSAFYNYCPTCGCRMYRTLDEEKEQDERLNIKTGGSK